MTEVGINCVHILLNLSTNYNTTNIQAINKKEWTIFVTFLPNYWSSVNNKVSIAFF